MNSQTNVFSPLRPDWVKDIPEEGYDDDFWKIINFYLLHSLCDEQSWKGHTLCEEYLWKKHPWKPDSYLKNKIIHAIWNSTENKLYMAHKNSDFKSMLENKQLDDNFCSYTYEQRACYTKVTNGKGNSNEIMSLFYHIRNGLAHGRYVCVLIDEKDYMLFLEDGKPKKDQFEVTARIALRKSSLIRVMEIIMNGPDKDPDYETEIIDSIRNGNKTKKSIMDDLDISEDLWKKISQHLSGNNQIKYDKNKKIWVLNE